MEKLPPQVSNFGTAHEKVTSLTLTYIMTLVREVHRDILQGLDDSEIHDLIVDALLRTSQLNKEWDSTAEIVQHQLQLVSPISSAIPVLAQREKRRKTVRELREISSGLIPQEALIGIDGSPIPGEPVDEESEWTF